MPDYLFYLCALSLLRRRAAESINMVKFNMYEENQFVSRCLWSVLGRLRPKCA